MLSYTILLYSLTGENECELCRKPCMSKHPLTHQDTIQGGEIYLSNVTHYQHDCEKRCPHFTSKSTHLRTSP